jgi:hypothetical protein
MLLGNNQEFPAWLEGRETVASWPHGSIRRKGAPPLGGNQWLIAKAADAIRYGVGIGRIGKEGRREGTRNNLAGERKKRRGWG